MNDIDTGPNVAITAVAEVYLRGVYEGDTATLAALFAPEAQVYGDINGQPCFKTIAAYLAGVAGRASPQSLGEPYRMRVLAVNSMGSIASVRLHSPVPPGGLRAAR